jgi:hypothetical protein
MPPVYNSVMGYPQIRRGPVLLVLVVVTFVSPIFAQIKEWREQAPCDSNFSVKVPSPLYKVSTFEGAHGAALEADGRFDIRWAAYAALQKVPVERQFGIVTYDGAVKESKEMKRLDGMSFMVGGDDVDPTDQKTVSVNGLVGKEYVYAKAIYPGRFTRGRIFYVNHRLYFVILIASSSQDLMSPDAEQFLNSFRLRYARKRG